jgi:hypothetical protein
MNLRILAVSMLLTAIVCASTALGIGPLGPPTATLKQGQFGIAAEYAHSDSDWEVTGLVIDGKMNDVKSNMFLAQPAWKF